MNAICYPSHGPYCPVLPRGPLAPVPRLRHAADLVVGAAALLMALGLVFHDRITWLLLGG